MSGSILFAVVVGLAVASILVARAAHRKRRVAERRAGALETSERRFRSLFQGSDHNLVVADLQGHCTMLNPAALRFSGLHPDQGAGRPLWELPCWNGNPEDAAAVQEACGDAARGLARRVDVSTRHDGRTGVAEFLVQPIVEREGRVGMLLATIRDLTDQRGREAGAAATEALAAVSHLATRMAHEINNPLASIRNSFLLVKDGVAPTYPYYPYVGAIEREISRMSGVTRQLYHTYKLNRAGDPAADGAETVDEAVSLLRQVHPGMEIELALDPSARRQSGIPAALLRHMVHSLVHHAADAARDGEPVRVRVTAEARWLVVSVTTPGRTATSDPETLLLDPSLDPAPRPTDEPGIGPLLIWRSAEAMGARFEAVPSDADTDFRLWIPLANGPFHA